MTTLDEACKSNPTGRWWIKGDGCDLVSGLEESLRLEWHGDIDFGTGDLKACYQAYRDRLKRIDSIVTDLFVDENRIMLLKYLYEEDNQLTEDITFVTLGMV